MHRKKLVCALASALLTALLLSAAPTLAVTPQIWGYSEGLALASDGALWGYADARGQIVIPIQYDSALQFYLGLGQVKLHGRLGIIRQDGVYLIEPAYDTLVHVNSGVYIAQKGELWGLVSILPFSDGMGGETNILYPFEYDAIELTQAGGIDVLTLTRDGKKSLLPLFELSEILLKKNVPSARFPLRRNALPSYSDVTQREWYTLWIDLAYNLGLMEGVGGNRFAPDRSMTVAEVLKLAACMESRATGDDFHRQMNVDEVWYRPYVNYCMASGIITSGEFDDLTRPITRAEMAKIFSATTLSKTMPTINSIDKVKAALPDVKPGDYAAGAIYGLYAKGVLTGSNSGLVFRPKANITRAEAAAVVSRMARAEERVSLWRSPAQPAPVPAPNLA